MERVGLQFHMRKQYPNKMYMPIGPDWGLKFDSKQRILRIVNFMMYYIHLSKTSLTLRVTYGFVAQEKRNFCNFNQKMYATVIRFSTILKKVNCYEFWKLRVHLQGVH